MHHPVEPSAITLRQLQQRLQRLLMVPDTRDVWVVAELSDVRVSGGHCYMELLEKDSKGTIVAKARGAIWASVYRPISYTFRSVTGQEFTTGIKVMVRVSVSFHEVYGMTLVISDVNPEFTMGDLLRRRRENIERLKSEGILNANRQLTFSGVPLRIAVISARGAAGFGDFINQLAANPQRLAFKVRLFPARLQGEGTPQSIIAALEHISEEWDKWDCVVIIRGGGASSDLIAYEDYDLAASVAQFPIPVIIGIGHERDVTLLDYVAHMRVKTPTAAAEWLISLGEGALDRLRFLGQTLGRTVNDRVTGSDRQLSSLQTQMTLLPPRAIERADSQLRRAAVALSGIGVTCIAPMRQRLEIAATSVRTAAANQLVRQWDRVEADRRLIEALSPQATMRRGFTVTRINGHAAYSADDIPEGTSIVTYFPDGIVTSTVKDKQTIIR